jgi:hypothetical protein
VCTVAYFYRMNESQTEPDDVPSHEAQDGEMNSARKIARKAVNWLLVPVAAGTIANAAVLGLSSVIGPEAGGAIVVIAVLGSAVAKFVGDKSTQEHPGGRAR